MFDSERLVAGDDDDGKEARVAPKQTQNMPKPLELAIAVRRQRSSFSWLEYSGSRSTLKQV